MFSRLRTILAPVTGAVPDRPPFGQGTVRRVPNPTVPHRDSLILFGVLILALLCPGTLSASGDQTLATNPVIDESLQEYLVRYRDTRQAWETLLDAVLAEFSPLNEAELRDVHVDPWASIEQESGYVPQIVDITRRAPTPEERITLTPDPTGNIGIWIPAKFRLAEVLGLGENLVHWDGEFKEPRLATNKDSDGRLVVMSRVRHWFFGEFVPSLPISGPALPTFRRYLDSRTLLDTAAVAISNEIAPKHYQLGNFSFRTSYQSRIEAWHRESLFDRTLTESLSVLPSSREQNQNSGAERQLEASLQKTLATLSVRVKKALLELDTSLAPEFRRNLLESLHALDSAREQIQKKLTSAGHLPLHCTDRRHEALPHRQLILRRLRTSLATDPVPPIAQVEDQIRQIQAHLQAHRELAHESD